MRRHKIYRRNYDTNTTTDNNVQKAKNVVSETVRDEIDKLRISLNPMIETKIRYHIDQRLGLIANGDQLTTRGSNSFAISEDSAHGGKSFMFKYNGEAVALITSTGVLYCRNIWLNGINIIDTLNKIFQQQQQQQQQQQTNLTDYVRHSDLKNGAYVMDIDDITTNKATIRTKLVISSAEPTSFTINNTHDQSTQSGRFTNIRMNDVDVIKQDRWTNSVTVNGLLMIEDGGDVSTTVLRSHVHFNYLLHENAELLIGKEEIRGDSVTFEFNFTGSDSVSNSFDVGFCEYPTLLQLFRDSVQTFGTIYDNNDHYINNNGNLYILNQYLEQSQTKQIIIGKSNTNHNAGMIKFVNLNDVAANCLQLGLVDDSNTAGHIDILKEYVNINVPMTVTGGLHVLHNSCDLLDDALTTGNDVAFTLGKDVDTNSAQLGYHLDSSNSFAYLTLTKMNGLKVYADKIETVTPFYCPNLYINGSTLDLAHIAHTNTHNNFTEYQRIETNEMNRWNHPLYLFTPKMKANQTTILTIGRTNYRGNCGYIGYNWVGNNNVNNFISISHHSYDLLYRFYRNRCDFYKPLTIICNADSDGPALRLMNSNTGHIRMSMGKELSDGNCAVFKWTYSSNGNSDSNNRLGLSFYGSDELATFYSNKVEITRSLNVSGDTSITGKMNVMSDDDVPLKATVPTLANGTGKMIAITDETKTAVMSLNKTANGTYQACYKLADGPAQLIVEPTTITTDGKLETTKTTAVDALGPNLQNAIFQLIYPIGSIYITLDKTGYYIYNNSTVRLNKFGCVFELLPSDLFLRNNPYSVDNRFGTGYDMYETTGVGQVGGEAFHTLTMDELPIIKGEFPTTDGGDYDGFSGVFYNAQTIGEHVVGTGGNFNVMRVGLNIGKGKSHNNLPPYKTVYMFQRIA